jgi:regulator of protease activity HflC (stomatin/prohibitin superfamily)
MFLPIALIILLLIFLSAAIKILKEYVRGVVFRLGRVIGEKGPGLIILIPFIDKLVRVDLRTVTMDVPPQDIITRDNVSVKVNAVVYFRVMDAVKAVVSVENYLYATSQLAQTTLRSVCGQAELDELLTERDKINHELQEILDRHTDPWGVKVSMVEVKHRRSKVIAAEGEFQASEKLFQASEKLSKNPVAIQLRFLQTVAEVASEKNMTIFLPIPVELLKPFLDAYSKKSDEGGQ